MDPSSFTAYDVNISDAKPKDGLALSNEALYALLGSNLLVVAFVVNELYRVLDELEEM